MRPPCVYLYLHIFEHRNQAKQQANKLPYTTTYLLHRYEVVYEITFLFDIASSNYVNYIIICLLIINNIQFVLVNKLNKFPSKRVGRQLKEAVTWLRSQPYL